jgi:SAM-dependent methyltransferase
VSNKVDLYDNAYGKFGLGVYEQIRVETYGEDLGQTSWVTTEESTEIPNLLGLGRESQVLEIGCGSGRYALQVAEMTGCRVVGVDVNAHGIRNANELARSKGLSSLARFEEGDASKGLPFGDESFDAVFANDVLCHIPGRGALLAEVLRILKPGGRLLFSDALVVGGLISQEEVAARSSIGYYVFSPRGVNEEMMKAAGFELIKVKDTTANAAAIAKRWNEAREKRKEELIATEGNVNFEGLQRFLACVRNLTEERRLLRFVYLGRRKG